MNWQSRAVTPDEALAVVESGMRVFVHGAAATPTPLLEALVRRDDLRDVTLYHLHTAGPAPFVAPEHRNRFLSVSLFVGAPVRRAVQEGIADFMPIFLSDIPGLLLTKRVPTDVALAASLAAGHVVAEINERMPRTHGNTLVPLSKSEPFRPQRPAAARARRHSALARRERHR